MVEVPEELVEAVGRGQELVPVPQVILAELAGDVPQGLEELGDRGGRGPQAEVGAGESDPGEARADGRLPRDERRGRPYSSAARTSR